ncbi:hypothetical protein lerEdw1_007248 [Lerista edwardsae]|nr:hypothetical protein lerEdw1_007248 [Lerista edwardsae]
MASQVHQNYHAECEAAVNDMVTLELRASYLYLALASAAFLSGGGESGPREHLSPEKLSRPSQGGAATLLAPEQGLPGRVAFKGLSAGWDRFPQASQGSTYYFQRDDVALEHVAAFFAAESLKRRDHAEKWLKFQNQRGGRIVLRDVQQKPEQDEWGSSLGAFQSALQTEAAVNEALLDLHQLAMAKKDPHLCDFLKSQFLKEQVSTIKQLGDHLTVLRRLGVPQEGLGEHLFDKLTLEDSQTQGW